MSKVFRAYLSNSVPTMFGNPTSLDLLVQQLAQNPRFSEARLKVEQSLDGLVWARVSNPLTIQAGDVVHACYASAEVETILCQDVWTEWDDKTGSYSLHYMCEFYDTFGQLHHWVSKYDGGWLQRRSIGGRTK